MDNTNSNSSNVISRDLLLLYKKATLGKHYFRYSNKDLQSGIPVQSCLNNFNSDHFHLLSWH